jgi:formate hydrogenlyase subunit 3/multisubunit Na+/H+ antiporter MnhD subunit
MGTTAETLLAHLPIAIIVIPLAGAVACFVLPRAARALMAVLGIAGTVASGWLAADVLEHGARGYVVGGWAPPLGIALHADGLAAALVALTAVLMTVCGSLARPRRSGDAFFTSWLFAWAALAVVFLSDDAFNVYVGLELLGIASVALVASPGTRPALHAALRYLAAGLTGSLLYLLGAALLYASEGTLSFAGLEDAGGAPAAAALAFMTVGLLLKCAVFPLHGWLPGAHGCAPAPASAVLSGVVVKSGIYLIWRLWSDTLFGVPADAAANLLGALGVGALLWGAAMAWRAERLKIVIAYSTVSQLGYLVMAVPLLRTAGVEALAGVMLLAAAHAFAKAGCFLAAGAVLARRRSDRLETLAGLVSQMPIAAFALGVGTVSLVGLPPSGGFAGKWLLIQASFAVHAWWWAAVFIAGSLLSAAVLIRALAPAFEAAPADCASRAERAGASEWTALAIALGALALGPLAGPWTSLVTEGSIP